MRISRETFSVLLATPRAPHLWGRAILVSVALGVVARIAWMVHVDAFVHPKTWEFSAVAANLLAGRGYFVERLGADWQTLITPTYPVLVAILEWLAGGTGRDVLVMVAQLVLSAALIALTANIGRMVGGFAAGVLAGAIVAGHPALILYSAEVHELVLDVVLAAGCLLLLLQQEDRRSGVALGLTGAMGAITRPTIGAFALIGLLIAGRKRNRGAALAAASLIGLGLLAWPVENHIVTGASPTACFYLWVGNNPASAYGGLADSAGRPVVEAGVEPVPRFAGLTEAQEGEEFCRAASAYIAADPVAAVARWGQRLVTFFVPSPVEGRDYPPGWIDAYRIGYVAEVLFAVAGLSLLWLDRRRSAAACLLCMIVGIAVTQSLFYVEGRHRLLVEPAYAALAATALVALISQLLFARSRTSDRQSTTAS